MYVRELQELLIRDWLVPAELKTKILYHYTTAAGLLGILSSGVLRGTNASFLNDSSEIAFGLSVCNEVLEGERDVRESDQERLLIERTLGWIKDDSSPYEIYVTSFSASRDLLSQWRGYGSDAGRFCLGFQLSQFSERDLFRLPQRVEYEAEGQRAKVRRAIEVACQALRGLDPPSQSQVAQTTAIDLALHLRRLMCSFKHRGFSEEEEWRSIHSVSPSDAAAVNFEPVRGALRPYVGMLHGSRMSARLPVVEICVGHAERRSAVAAALRLMLSRYGYDNVSVTETSIPFTG